MPMQPNNPNMYGYPNTASGPMTSIGAGLNNGQNTMWSNPYYPPTQPPQYQQPTQQGYPYTQPQQPVAPAQQTQETSNNGPTLDDVMASIQDLTNQVQNLQTLIKKQRNNYNQNGSYNKKKYQKKEEDDD